jgi:hypothetical protein
MKMRSFVLVVSILSFSLSGFASGAVLWDSNFCKVAMIRCGHDQIFVHDQYGRCGCLVEGSFLQPDTCRGQQIDCNELAGESYATLTSNGDFVGCGCFKTN